ncbi:hypothetical protein AX23_06695 [Brucella melitensis 548]|nr:hypothetical protein AX23_06695 [Brucella melitensis 548]
MLARSINDQPIKSDDGNTRSILVQNRLRTCLNKRNALIKTEKRFLPGCMPMATIT